MTDRNLHRIDEEQMLIGRITLASVIEEWDRPRAEVQRRLRSECGVPHV